MVETKENSISSVDRPAAHQRAAAERTPGDVVDLHAWAAAAYGDAGDTGSKTFYSSTTISVAGGQGNGTAYLLDGGDNTDAMSNVNMPFPFPDALQEFSVETSAVSSRFGTHPGATVNVVTKSGSNAFHGDLFEYFRNGDLNARNFFAARHDSLKRNQFGGTAGGRIITDKLFFFGGYQGTRKRSNSSAVDQLYSDAGIARTETSARWLGADARSSGKALTLLDPTRQCAVRGQPDSGIAAQSGGD